MELLAVFVLPLGITILPFGLPGAVPA